MKTDVQKLLEGHGVSLDFKYHSFTQEVKEVDSESNEQADDPQILTEIFAQLEKTPPRKKFGEQLLTDVFAQIAQKSTKT